nr:hypothetical protein [uncultured Undibacterium sp.]
MTQQLIFNDAQSKKCLATECPTAVSVSSASRKDFEFEFIFIFFQVWLNLTIDKFSQVAKILFLSGMAQRKTHECGDL